MRINQGSSFNQRELLSPLLSEDRQRQTKQLEKGKDQPQSELPSIEQIETALEQSQSNTAGRVIELVHEAEPAPQSTVKPALESDSNYRVEKQEPLPHSFRAISAYQTTMQQQQREQLATIVGLDVYV